MENKQIEVMSKGQFELLGKAEQVRLMEMWRDRYTNKEIFEAMGYTSHQFYKIIGKLGVKAKDNAPSITKLRTEDDSETQSAPTVETEAPVMVQVQESASNEQQDTKTINISISDTVDKERASALFQSVLAFLSTGGEYNVTIEVSK